MLRNWKFATMIAIAISACGTISSVYAGGNGGHGGNHGSSGGGRSSGGFKPSSGGFKPSSGNSGGGNSGVVRRGNLGGINFGGSNNSMPKNTGIVPKVGLPNNSNGSSVIRNIGQNKGSGIKLPGGGTIGSSGKGPKPISGLNGKPGNLGINPKVGIPGVGGSGLGGSGKGGLGISLGDIVGKGPKGPFPGNGPGKGPGKGPGNGNGNGHGHHDHHGHHHHGHHHHHHGFPPIVISLPVCQPNYCPPPCPPIYYPQPYPYPVPVSEPVPLPIPVQNGDPMVVVNNDITVNTTEAKPTSDKPVETAKPGEELNKTEATSTETKPADSKPVETTEVVNATKLPQIPVGATLTLQGKDLSDKEGQVVLQLGEFALPATIKEWKNDSVTCTLPALGLTKASKATLHVLKADGKTANTMDCELVTTLPTSVEVAPAMASEIERAKYEQ